jgi:hypothetical protein
MLTSCAMGNDDTSNFSSLKEHTYLFYSYCVIAYKLKFKFHFLALNTCILEVSEDEGKFLVVINEIIK